MCGAARYLLNDAGLLLSITFAAFSGSQILSLRALRVLYGKWVLPLI